MSQPLIAELPLVALPEVHETTTLTRASQVEAMELAWREMGDEPKSKSPFCDIVIR